MDIYIVIRDTEDGAIEFGTTDPVAAQDWVDAHNAIRRHGVDPVRVIGPVPLIPAGGEFPALPEPDPYDY